MRWRPADGRKLIAVVFLAGMNLNRLGQAVDRRRAVAGLVLVGTLLVCLWIGKYTVAPAILCGTHCTPADIVQAQRELGPQTPSWAIPAAVAVGSGGGILALLILRPRRWKS
jgi:hypothetical protein